MSQPSPSKHDEAFLFMCTTQVALGCLHVGLHGHRDFETHFDPSCSLHKATTHILYWIGAAKTMVPPKSSKVQKHGVTMLAQARVRTRRGGGTCSAWAPGRPDRLHSFLLFVFLKVKAQIHKGLDTQASGGWRCTWATRSRTHRAHCGGGTLTVQTIGVLQEGTGGKVPGSCISSVAGSIATERLWPGRRGSGI